MCKLIEGDDKQIEVFGEGGSTGRTWAQAAGWCVAIMGNGGTLSVGGWERGADQASWVSEAFALKMVLAAAQVACRSLIVLQQFSAEAICTGAEGYRYSTSNGSWLAVCSAATHCGTKS